MDDYIYSTEYYHPNNTFTMDDYLNNYMPADYELLYVDGSYAEIAYQNEVYEVHAGGNGDSFNHKITFKFK